jgi:hypothetical protein
MKNRAKYFDNRGTEISADDAFDRHGTLRDGFAMRVPTTMRDSLRMRDAKPQFTDGHSIVDPAAGLKPGWRMPTVQDRTKVRDAYQHYETSVTNAYRVGDGTQCPECFGSGEDEDGDCKACNGTGIMAERSSRTSKGGKGFGSTNEGGYDTPYPASDSRSVKDQAYSSYDNDLQNAWRRP